jgi:hypothetical protein
VGYGGIVFNSTFNNISVISWRSVLGRRDLIRGRLLYTLYDEYKGVIGVKLLAICSEHVQHFWSSYTTCQYQLAELHLHGFPEQYLPWNSTNTEQNCIRVYILLLNVLKLSGQARFTALKYKLFSSLWKTLPITYCHGDGCQTWKF